MFKEFKILLYVTTIILFIFFILNYYFSDSNKKKSYRSIKNIDEKLIQYSEKLKILESDTENIVEYLQSAKNKNKKRYNFWNLINGIDQ